MRQLTLADALTAGSPRDDAPIAIVVSCSKRKRFAVAEPATAEELDVKRDCAQTRLAVYETPAADLYTGRAFMRSRAAVEQFRTARPDLPVSLKIVSAGYGLVGETESLVPYEVTLGENRTQWKARGRRLGLPRALSEVCRGRSLTIVALSVRYAIAADVAELPEPRQGGRVVVIGSESLHPPPHGYFVRAGRKEARALRVAERDVHAEVLASLLAQLAEHGTAVVDRLGPDPASWDLP